MKKILVVASANKGKLKEIQNMLPSFTVKGYKEFDLDFDIEETGETFYENALIKAKAVSKALNLPALADDSGISVNALNGAPGVYSARYSDEGTDSKNCEKLLKNLKGVVDRSAKFVCCMVYYSTTGEIVSETGETYGYILEEMVGNNGFGYDPLFWSSDLKKSFGIATDEEKNSVSHRARALEKIKDRLR